MTQPPADLAADLAADLDFTCTAVSADRYAAAPTVLLHMRAEETTSQRIHAVALRCQVRIEPLRRRYTDAEAARVVDLFGGRERWGSTMHPLQLAFITQMLPGFAGSCEFDLALPLSYDVDVAAHKLLASLESGQVALDLLFSGTVFSGAPGSIMVQPVPWHKEAAAKLPVSVWREAIDACFAGDAWVRMRRDTYDELAGFRSEHGLTGWDEAVRKLLERSP